LTENSIPAAKSRSPRRPNAGSLEPTILEVVLPTVIVQIIYMIDTNTQNGMFDLPETNLQIAWLSSETPLLAD